MSVRWRVAGGVALAAAAVLIGYMITGSDEPAPRARQYLEFKACLLTDAQGIAGKQAGPVWAGMNTASLKTRARIQYLPVFGPATTPNALPYLASLVQRRCDLVVAAGDLPVAATKASATRYRKTHFVIVGERSSQPNLTAVDVPEPAIPEAVSKLIVKAVNDAST